MPKDDHEANAKKLAAELTKVLAENKRLKERLKNIEEAFNAKR